MCGIGLLKFYKFKPPKKLLIECGEIISNEQSNRGPDNSSTLITEDEMTMICHQRLSILDLSESSNQPFQNKSYIGSFNGEIYNYPELSKSNLAILKSDTLYLKNRINPNNIKDELDKFDGPFSMILYEKKTQKVIISRDRFGEKPLFYFKNNDYLIVASKVKSIILVLKKINYKFSINNFHIKKILKYGFDFDKETPIKEIKNLQKGTYACDDSNFINKTYCKSIKRFQSKINIKNVPSLFKEFFEESIIQKLRADVPIGVFLSGGIDSTLIACAASKFYNKKIEHFTIDFPNKNQVHFKRSKIISDKLGINNHQITLDSDKALHAIKNLAPSLTCPTIDPAQIPLLILSKYASKYTPVVLVGDGADELFNGYLRYERFKKINFLRKINFYKLFPLINFIKPNSKLSRYWESISAKNKISSYLNIFYLWYKEDPFLKRELHINYKKILNNSYFDPCIIDQNLYLPEVILRKSDSCTMQYGIESRLPFLSNKLISLSQKIRRNFPRLKKKDIFISLIRYYLGDKIYKEYMNLPKYGLTLPLKQIFEDELIQEYLDNYFTYDNISRFQFLDQKLILNNWINIKTKKDFSNLYGMWALFTFLQWNNNLEIQN